MMFNCYLHETIYNLHIFFAGDLYMITEFACHGNMRDFLRSRRLPDSDSGYEKPLSYWQPPNKPLTYKDLISFSYQIARGMEYLASKKVSTLILLQRNKITMKRFVNQISRNERNNKIIHW